jgi:hypothetical protein
MGRRKRTIERKHAPSLLVCLFATSCSFLLEIGVQQCEVDADCAAHGLVGAVCVRSLCQKPAAESSSGAAAPAEAAKNDAMSAVDAGMMKSSEIETPPVGTARSSANQPAPAGQSASGSPPPAARASSGSSAAGTRAGAGGMSNPGAAGASGCAPGACSECTDARDCERRGIVHGVCSAGICYTPAAQCSADKDCVSRGPEFAGGRCLAMQCLPNPQWRCEPPPTPVDGEMRQIDVPVIDALSLGALADVHILACDKRDLFCDRPVTSMKTARDGHLLMMLPTNFAGYLQQTEASGYMPAMYFLPAIIPDDGVLDGFPLLRAGIAIESLAASVGSTVDNTRGHMMLIVEDCFRKPVGSVSFASQQQDKSTVTYYMQDNLPTTSAMATSTAGQGGFLNFPVGAATVTLTQAGGLILNTVTLLVRAGFISVAFMPPEAR